MKNLRYYTVTIVNLKNVDGIKVETILSGNLISAVRFAEMLNPGWSCTNAVPK